MNRFNPRLVVISGGPGSGKTTLLAELERLGHPVLPEVARQIIQEQVQARGRALPWDDRVAYTALMLERSVASYREQAGARRLTFCDRGIPDTLGYARLIGLAETGAIEAACQANRYAVMVFLAPPWREIYATDSERRQDFAEAERTFAVLEEVYREHGYEVVTIPKLPPPARAQFVLARLATISPE